MSRYLSIATVLGLSLFSLGMIPTRWIASESSEINKIAKETTVLLSSKQFGSGVIIGKQGNRYSVLTAKHVVGPADTYQVTTVDGKAHPLNNHAIQKSPDLDLAVVSFESPQNYHVAPLGNSDELLEGNPVFIAGWPAAGNAIPHIYQLTTGAISGLSPRALAGGYRLIYTNVTRAGMSGGPIFNGKGQVVGIHGQAEGQEVYLPGQEQSSTVIKAGFNLGIPINTFLKSDRSGLTASISELPPPPIASTPPRPSALFVQPPRLVSAVTSHKDANVLGVSYYFTLFLPEQAGASLQQVDLCLTEGVTYPKFSIRGTQAFAGTRGNRGAELPLGLVVTDPSSRTLSITFDPPITPGRQITLELRPLRNPTPGTYLFEVKGYPTGETARGQYVGLGRLDFYPKSRW